MARRGERRGGLFWVNVLVAMLFLTGIWTIGLVRFANDIPERIADPKSKTDAIIVLTGGSGRLDAGLELLARNHAGKLFVSGVYQGLDVRNLLQLARRQPKDLEARIGIGNAVNTKGNATESAEWVKQQDIKSLRLVTAAYHMPRSLLEFRHAMPDLTVVPNPVFPKHVKQDQWWAWPGTANLIISEYNKFLMAWVRHRSDRFFGAPARPEKSEIKG